MNGAQQFSVWYITISDVNNNNPAPRDGIIKSWKDFSHQSTAVVWWPNISETLLTLHRPYEAMFMVQYWIYFHYHTPLKSSYPIIFFSFLHHCISKGLKKMQFHHCYPTHHVSLIIHEQLAPFFLMKAPSRTKHTCWAIFRSPIQVNLWLLL